MKILLKNNILNLTVDAEIYPEAVLFKCLYWYTNTFDVDITKANPLQYKISLSPLHKSGPIDWEIIVAKLKRDLVDFKLRQCITDETKTVRELIIAKAFAYYDHETMPASEISDPVGFDPQSVNA